VTRITQTNRKGFSDAVNASEDSEKFVRECFKTIADLEYQIERRR